MSPIQVEAGSFRTRCLVCDTRFGAISLNQSVGRDDASPREKGTRLVAIRAAALALARVPRVWCAVVRDVT